MAPGFISASAIFPKKKPQPQRELARVQAAKPKGLFWGWEDTLPWSHELFRTDSDARVAGLWIFSIRVIGISRGS